MCAEKEPLDIELTGLSKEDLFHDHAELLARACKLREDKTAYVKD